MQSFYFYTSSILFSFKFNENSKAVHDLQMFLGITVDSDYGPKTRKAHIAYLKKHKLPRGGVPGIPVKIMPITVLVDK